LESRQVLSDPTKKATYLYARRFAGSSFSQSGAAATAARYGAKASPAPSATKWPYGRSYADDDEDEDGHL
jgi:hypothetical protein